jgi:hypothetical protein
MANHREVNAPKFNYTLFLAIVRLSFAFSDQPLSPRKFFYVMEQLETRSFNSKVDQTFTNRKKYLMLNLRIPEMVTFPPLRKAFKLIYAGDRWLKSKFKINAHPVTNRIISFKQSILDLRNLSL